MKLKIFLWASLLISLIVGFVFVGRCYINHIFPLKYEQNIIESSIEFDVNPAIISSIINTESGFKKNAISGKGAVGLMQIMPKTAEFIAEKIGQEFAIESLIEPSVNIRYGTYYISYLSTKFTDFNSVICAYNAGEGIVGEWLKNKTYSKDGKRLSLVPYTETSNYLKRVQKNFNHYSKLKVFKNQIA